MIEERDHLPIPSASGPSSNSTPHIPITQRVGGWQVAQLQSAFKEEESWGDQLASLIVEEKRSASPSSKLQA